MSKELRSMGGSVGIRMGGYRSLTWKAPDDRQGMPASTVSFRIGDGGSVSIAGDFRVYVDRESREEAQARIVADFESALDVWLAES